MSPAVSGLAEAAVSAFGGVADTLGAAFGNVAGAASSAFSGALDVVGPAASEAADRLSSALSGAVAFVSGRFPSLGAAAEAVGQGLASEFQSIRDLVASVFSGDLSGALDAALGLFSGFRETAFAIFAALGEAVLGVFAFVWGQVTASFPDFGAWAASSASAVAGAFGKALGWVREKLYGLVDMLPDWALEKLGWKRVHSGEFFHEFVTECPDTEKALAALAKRDILGGLPVEGGILWCVTELTDKKTLDHVIGLLQEVSGQ